MVTSVSSATTNAGAATDRTTLSQGFDQFLKLLTTQLKNQDPLSPMDSTQFTNQLVGFSQVEQQIKMNDNLSNLVNMTKTNQTMLGLSYIGLNVEVDGNAFKYFGNGATPQISYTLPGDAAKTTISILDQNNNVIYSGPGELAAGTHKLIWNGLNNDGQQAPAGTYQILVGALNSDQKNMTVPTVVPGVVEGIESADDGAIQLLINNKKVPIDQIHKATL